MHASKALLVLLSLTLVRCSWWKEHVAQKNLKQVCTKAHEFSWEDYKGKGSDLAKKDFEDFMFKDIDSKLAKRIWKESFEQPQPLRYSYFSSQVRSFGIDANHCLVLESLFEDKIPGQVFSISEPEK